MLLIHSLEIVELNSLSEEGTEEQEDEEDEQVEKNRVTKIRVSRKSPMELLVMSVPQVHVSCLLYPVFYFLSLDTPILLISLFPEDSRNALTISLCLAWETFIWSVIISWGNYSNFAITSFVLTLKDTVDLAMRRISFR